MKSDKPIRFSDFEPLINLIVEAKPSAGNRLWIRLRVPDGLEIHRETVLAFFADDAKLEWTKNGGIVKCEFYGTIKDESISQLISSELSARTLRQIVIDEHF